MRAKNTQSLLGQALRGATLAFGSLLALTSNAATPGIAGGTGTPVFNLSAAPMRSVQPNGKSIYAWGYGCKLDPEQHVFFCGSDRGRELSGRAMPGPTLIVTEGDLVTVNLINNLPAAAGNTSILFPDFRFVREPSPCRPRIRSALALRPAEFRDCDPRGPNH